MSLRITTWNVNGIRNPFAYQPWRDRRTFEGMFDVLEADIVVFQETKIQRKDLRDDMVLVSGWDCFFSLPRHKKGRSIGPTQRDVALTQYLGYSGVVIYTRNSTCAPIRAEEGITGVLACPNTSTSFRDLPDDEQIGGYPSAEQLSLSEVDALTLDSEGRCIILEFPAFVLLGTYCPASRDETRDEFRLGFLNVLDARIRNLAAMGKRVIWAGDLNISREELDTAAAEESMRRHGMEGHEYISTPSRRLFNQLLVGGKVVGDRDEGREKPILWDICRGFHEGRKGMYTCWETKINARPGNYGARIDYVLCSAEMKDWFCESNIQEGLLGSDHCPVFAVLKEQVNLGDRVTYVSDIVNPPGMFEEGKRKVDWSTKNLLPMSGKLIPEFDRRRNIRDMFSQKPSLSSQKSLASSEETEAKSPSTSVQMALPEPSNGAEGGIESGRIRAIPSDPVAPKIQTPSVGSKRIQKLEATIPSAKRTKSASQSGGTNASSKGQQSLKGFFQTKAQTTNGSVNAKDVDTVNGLAPQPMLIAVSTDDGQGGISGTASIKADAVAQKESGSVLGEPSPITTIDEASAEVSRQGWGKLFSKPISPNCEHGEPCKTMLTKKPGVNCGRSFWMCARPLGPSGNKEKNTQWRCSTFIWASDWTGTGNG